VSTTDKLIIGGREFSSRLMVGTGKYASFEQMVQAIELSGAEIITVAVRRVNTRSCRIPPGAIRRMTLSGPAAWPGRRGSPIS
jgi:thiazole synthase ThiGH ThiG subunit